MRRDEALIPFARGLHQDVFVGLNGLDDLVDELLANMNRADTEAFRVWLEKALRTLTASELKGLLNRASPCIGFNSKGALELLGLAADRLGVKRGP